MSADRRIRAVCARRQALHVEQPIVDLLRRFLHASVAVVVDPRPDRIRARPQVDPASLLSLARLFRLYEEGQIFTARVVATIRRLGFLIIGAQFADLLFQVLSSIVLTMHNGVGHREVSVGLGSNHLEMLLIAAIVIFSSWVMDEGRRLQAESDLTI